MSGYWIGNVALPDPDGRSDCPETLTEDGHHLYCTLDRGHAGRHLAFGLSSNVCAAWPGEHEPTEADLSDEVAR